uniref:Pto-like serine/threonine kinase n=1 Tax=Solanum tuberosum TaxID=4113 RepID=M1CZ01_SOLTU
MVTVLCKVLCARPALDRSLPREQVNLANCEMNSQEKRQLKHIIDPDLLGKVRPDSFRKFGETTVKCLAESGVDRPSMGEVLWNLEYALHLQEHVIQENSTIHIGELSLQINDFSHVDASSNATQIGTLNT